MSPETLRQLANAADALKEAQKHTKVIDTHDFIYAALATINDAIASEVVGEGR